MSDSPYKALKESGLLADFCEVLGYSLETQTEDPAEARRQGQTAREQVNAVYDPIRTQAEGKLLTVLFNRETREHATARFNNKPLAVTNIAMRRDSQGMAEYRLVALFGSAAYAIELTKATENKPQDWYKLFTSPDDQSDLRELADMDPKGLTGTSYTFDATGYFQKLDPFAKDEASAKRAFFRINDPMGAIVRNDHGVLHVETRRDESGQTQEVNAYVPASTIQQRRSNQAFRLQQMLSQLAAFGSAEAASTGATVSLRIGSRK